jgi:murein DD-endopeptidase MepM/ murein hydrolase activator NlpD
LAPKNFTLMIVPEGLHARVQRVQIPKKGVWALGLVALGACMGLTALVVHYAYVVDAVFEAQDLRAENARLKERLAVVTAKVDDVDSHLADLRSFDEQLRSMTGLADTKRTPGMGPGTPGSGGTNRSNFAFAVPLAGEDAATIQLRDALLDSRMAGLSAEAQRQMGSLAELVDHFAEREVELRTTPSVTPAKGLLTSSFGSREDPFTGGSSMHSGLDIANTPGTDIVASADGVVVLAGENGEYGNCVVIDHGRDTKTLYGHLQRLIVKVGQQVKRGEHIGYMGTTGRSTGTHLHYEVRLNNVPVNPRKYIIR